MEIAHGTTYSEAHRCRRARDGKTYCDLCKVITSAYSRENYDKYKDSKNEKRKARRKELGYPDSNRRRAIRFGVVREKYTRQQIIDRDGLNCYLCTYPVDLEANCVVGQPGWELYPHIDHVIPMALGGPDTLENVKIAHAKCNLYKGKQLLDDTPSDSGTLLNDVPDDKIHIINRWWV